MRMQFDREKSLWYATIDGYTYWSDSNEALINLAWKLNVKIN